MKPATAGGQLASEATRPASIVAASVMSLFLVGGLGSPPLFYLAFLLSVGGVCAWPRVFIPFYVREPLAWLAVMLAAAVGVRAWMNLGAGGFPGDSELVWDHIRYAAIVPLLIGGWLSFFRYRWRLLLTLASVGVLFYYFRQNQEILSRLPIGDVKRGSYPELGLISVTATVLFAGGGLYLWSDWRRSGGKRLGWQCALVWLTALVSAVLVLCSQVRASWLSLIVFGIVSLVYIIARAVMRGSRDDRRRVLKIAAAVGVVAVLFGILLHDFVFWVLSRGDDLRSVPAMLTGQLDGNYTGSFATRYRLLVQGLRDISDHPLIGVGPAALRDMAQYAIGVNVDGKGNYHSTYINLAVAMGLPWALLWVGVHAVAIGRAGHELIVVRNERVLGFSLMGACFVHFFNLLFTVRIWSLEGSAAYVMLMSLVFAVILRGPLARWAESGVATRSESVSPAHP